MSFPLVSVITAVYRDFSGLEATVASLAAQKYPNVNYLVCDDGSENFSREAVEALSTQYAVSCRILHSSENKGTVRNLNGAIAQSLGKYIFFLSAGDTFDDPAALADWVAFMERTHAVSSLALRRVVDDPADSKGSVLPEKWQQHAMERGTPAQLFRLLSLGNFVSGSATAYDAAFLRTHPFDERFRLLEDYPKTLSLLSQGIPVRLFPRVCIRHLSGGISANTRLHPQLVADHVLLARTLLSAPPAYRFAADYLCCALGEGQFSPAKRLYLKTARRLAAAMQLHRYQN